ncbi:MAG: hypothetical protein KDK41_10870 [Leptospiraceae bacterium]|nr:hypothetical protein [Leptospiraceae bacterium]
MKKLVSLAMVAAMTLMLGVSTVSAEADGEQILEECLLEAHNRGYDIESDAFVNRLVDAIENDKDSVIKQICPATFAKYPD